MNDDADQIIGLYERHARTWDKERSKSLFEKHWLNCFLKLVPRGGSILDIGCGSGEPIAQYFISAGYTLTGIDSSPAMIELCKARFSNETWVAADMRALSLGTRFDGILAWDSFFHLRQSDQRKMFSIFAKHAAPNAALMFTSGPREGVAMGEYHGEPLYHASLGPDEYRALLHEQAFEVAAHVAEDAACGGRTIWLARRS